jgi:hypothetical protein
MDRAARQQLAYPSPEFENPATKGDPPLNATAATPYDGNAESTRPSHSEQTPRFLQPIGVEISLQQGELDRIVLRATAANAFVLTRERRKHLDRAGKIPAFERREAMCQRRKVRAG